MYFAFEGDNESGMVIMSMEKRVVFVIEEDEGEVIDEGECVLKGKGGSVFYNM